MTITNPWDLRGRIEAKHRQAEMLLSVASHDTVNEQVRLGMRELEEALSWLQRKPGSGPVHLLFDLATWRLNIAMRLVRTEGAEAEAW